jgi:hypothetical protein
MKERRLLLKKWQNIVRKNEVNGTFNCRGDCMLEAEAWARAAKTKIKAK